MPLFTVTMKSNGSTNEKDRLSRAIHAASIAAGYPEDDLFQRFPSLGPSDFRVDLYYPELPRPRTDQMVMIEVLVSSGTDTNRKKSLVAALVEKLGEAYPRTARRIEHPCRAQLWGSRTYGSRKTIHWLWDWCMLRRTCQTRSSWNRDTGSKKVSTRVTES